MDFKLFQSAISSLINAIEQTAVVAVRSLKANTFATKITNLPNIQKIQGKVEVDQSGLIKEVKGFNSPLEAIIGLIKGIKFPKSIEVSNFPAFPKPITEIKVTNFPKAPEFPRFPHEFRISNPEISELKNINMGIDDLTGEIKKIKFNPTIKVEAPKPERIVVPPANVSVTQQEIDYEKLSTLLAEKIEKINYQKLGEAVGRNMPSFTSGGGGKYAYKDASGAGATGLVDADRHVQVDVVDGDPTGKYQIADKDTGDNTKYYGFTDKGENWYILQEDTIAETYRYTKGSGEYVSAWANRTDLTYDYYHTIF